jgi:HD-like signal output (HDOD) protein/CheY-like chemotaxis protein
MISTKKRILFVDDDPSILAGLQLLLYKERTRWEMKFANGGEPALAELRAKPFDVVVSDMRMPGMDGATFLNIVKDSFPATARIMLSGHAEREAIFRALPALHQLLSKPCDEAILRAAIERGLNRSTAGDDGPIGAMIGRVTHLPTAPAVYSALVLLVESATADIGEYAALVRRDPALVAKILQLVNSAYFGASQTTSVDQAVGRLGIEQLRELVRKGSLFVSADADANSVCKLQVEATRIAALTRRFDVDVTDREPIYTAALLSHVGEVALLAGASLDASTEIVDNSSELERLGIAPNEVGASLLELWGLPTSIVDIVRYRHQPHRAPEKLRTAAAAVHVACALICENDAAHLDLASLDQAGVMPQLQKWRAAVLDPSA